MLLINYGAKFTNMNPNSLAFKTAFKCLANSTMRASLVTVAH